MLNIRAQVEIDEQIRQSFLKASRQKVGESTEATGRNALHRVELSCGTISPFEYCIWMRSEHARASSSKDCIRCICLPSITCTRVTEKVTPKRNYKSSHDSVKSRNTADANLILRICFKLSENWKCFSSSFKAEKFVNFIGHHISTLWNLFWLTTEITESYFSPATRYLYFHCNFLENPFEMPSLPLLPS